MFAAECFATAGPVQGPESSSSSSSSSPSVNAESQDRLVKINTGRPDIPALIRQNIENIAAADPFPGRTAVFVSGPAALADVTRAAVHKVLKDTRYDVEYFEEDFGW
jgi:ferric-chelate reductase